MSIQSLSSPTSLTDAVASRRRVAEPAQRDDAIFALPEEAVPERQERVQDNAASKKASEATPPARPEPARADEASRPQAAKPVSRTEDARPDGTKADDAKAGSSKPQPATTDATAAQSAIPAETGKQDAGALVTLAAAVSAEGATVESKDAADKDKTEAAATEPADGLLQMLDAAIAVPAADAAAIAAALPVPFSAELVAAAVAPVVSAAAKPGTSAGQAPAVSSGIQAAGPSSATSSLATSLASAADVATASVDGKVDAKGEAKTESKTAEALAASAMSGSVDSSPAAATAALEAPKPAEALLQALNQTDPSGLAQPRAGKAEGALSGPDAASAAAAQTAATFGQSAGSGPPTPIHVVPIEIGLRALAGAKRFDIRLDPGELGRVDVNLEISDKGEVTARLVVDRVETLHLLQRDARTLERAFEQAGLKPSDAGVDITLRDPADQSGFRQNRQQEDAPRRSRIGIETQDDLAIPADAAPVRSRARLGGVDLSI